MDPAVTPPVESHEPSTGGVVFRALFIGVLMAVLGGRMAAPIILASATKVLSGAWFGQWVVGSALPAILFALVAMSAGAAAARVSGARARLGVLSFAGVAALTGIPQVMEQFGNAASDPRFRSAAWGALGNIVLALGCVVLGGWLAAGKRWSGAASPGPVVEPHGGQQ